jgi:hypothetical protein
MKRESGHGEVMEKYQLYPEKEDLNKMQGNAYTYI